MDFIEFLALIILLAVIMICFALFCILPVYIAYRKGKNWKNYILPSIFFGPLVIPFALYAGKHAGASTNVESLKAESSTGYIAGANFSNLDSGEVLKLKLSAKNAGDRGILSFTDKRIMFDGGVGSKHSFAVPIRNLKSISFMFNTIQFTAFGLKGATLSIAKNDMKELKIFVSEMEHPQINSIKMEKHVKQNAPKAMNVPKASVNQMEEETQDPAMDSPTSNEPGAARVLPPPPPPPPPIYKS
jgi:hypothetical protein